jgi:hypothetical protein
MYFAQVVNRRVFDSFPVKVATSKSTHIKYVLWYSDGKGVDSTKGYYLSVYPVKLDGHFELAYMFSGLKEKIQDAKRYDEGDLLNLWVSFHNDAVHRATLKGMVHKVSAANGVEVDDERFRLL